MNEEVYTTDKLKIGFVLSYMNEKEAKDWRELYLKDIEDPATGKLVYPTFGAFLAEVHKAFRSADRVQDALCKLENSQKVDPVKNAFATIRALTKDEREAFTKMMLKGKEDF